MMSIKILGIGTTLACGIGIASLKKALLTGQTDDHSDVCLEDLEAYVPASRCRRLDPLGRMALLSACLAFKDAGLSLGEEGKSSTGIVFGTALGPQHSTFAFLEDIISSGDSCASSFAFTNSVHNTPAAQISLALGIRGPLRTITTLSYTTGACLQAASSWLRKKVIQRVILVLGEECSAVMDYVVRRLGGGQVGPSPFSRECTYRSRPGCVAFVLGNDGDAYCRLTSVEVCLTATEAAERLARSDMLFCAAAGKADEFEPYEKLWAAARRTGAYSSIYGSLLTGLGIELAIAALSLREETVFSVPGGSCLRSVGPSSQNSHKPKSISVAGISGPGRVTLIQVEK